MGDVTRRTVLSSVPYVVGLAGCVGIPGSESGSTGGPFDSVHVDGVDLVVRLAEGVSVDRVNVIGPDGSRFDGRAVQPGETRLTFEVGSSYQPGDHRIVAVTAGEVIDERVLSIAPDVEIVEVGIGANHLERMPENLNFKEEQALVGLVNNGTGPEVIDRLNLAGDIPNPTTAPDGEYETTGVFDTRDGFGDLADPVVPVGESVVFYTTTEPFLVTGDGTMCESEPQSGVCEVILHLGVSDRAQTSLYSISYSSSDNDRDCSMTIGEEVE